MSEMSIGKQVKGTKNHHSALPIEK